MPGKFSAGEGWFSLQHDLTDDELKRFVDFDVFYDPMPWFGFIPQWTLLAAIGAIVSAMIGLGRPGSTLGIGSNLARRSFRLGRVGPDEEPGVGCRLSILPAEGGVILRLPPVVLRLLPVTVDHQPASKVGRRNGPGSSLFMGQLCLPSEFSTPTQLFQAGTLSRP